MWGALMASDEEVVCAKLEERPEVELRRRRSRECDGSRTHTDGARAGCFQRSVPDAVVVLYADGATEAGRV